jgi:hypothetical protein
MNANSQTAVNSINQPALKIKDIKKQSVYCLRGMDNSAYNERAVTVKTNAVVNGKRAFVMAVQGWCMKDLNNGVCALVTVGVENLQVADLTSDAQAWSTYFSQAQLVVAYLERATGIKAVGKIKESMLEGSWSISSKLKSDVRVDIRVDIDAGSEISVWGEISIDGFDVSIEVDDTRADASEVIKEIKEQVVGDSELLTRLASLLIAFNE